MNHHLTYVVLSYAVTLVVIAGLFGATLRFKRQSEKRVAELEGPVKGPAKGTVDGSP